MPESVRLCADTFGESGVVDEEEDPSDFSALCCSPPRACGCGCACACGCGCDVATSETYFRVKFPIRKTTGNFRSCSSDAPLYLALTEKPN